MNNDNEVESLITKLRERYSPIEIPKCSKCDGELTLQRSGDGINTWACSGQIVDDNGWHFAPGRGIADEHYQESQWYDCSGGGDKDVLELITVLEQTQQRSNKFTTENADLHYQATQNRQLITELQARLETPVFIPGRVKPAELAGSGERKELLGFNRACNECADLITGAGFKVIRGYKPKNQFGLGGDK